MSDLILTKFDLVFTKWDIVLRQTIFIVHSWGKKGNGGVRDFRSPDLLMRMRLFYDHGFLKRGDVLLCLKCADGNFVKRFANAPTCSALYMLGFRTVEDDVNCCALLGERWEDEDATTPFAWNAFYPKDLIQGVTQEFDDGVGFACLTIA